MSFLDFKNSKIVTFSDVKINSFSWYPKTQNIAEDRSRGDLQNDIKIVKIGLRKHEISFFEKGCFFSTFYDIGQVQ
jgi:hypothetical protein